MSIELPSGLKAKTGFLPDPEADDSQPWVHYAELGDGPGKPIAEVVEELKVVWQRPELLQDPIFRGFVDYLKSMEPVVVMGRQMNQQTILTSTLPGSPNDYFGDLQASPSSVIVGLMGQDVSRDDLIGFTYYVLTNTDLDMPRDSRLDFLAALKGEQADS